MVCMNLKLEILYRVGLMIMPKGTDTIKELKNYLKGEDFKRFLDFNSNILGEE